MTNGLGPHDPGAVDQLEELPILDPSTAHRVTDRVVRPPMAFWDRSKILILLFALWWILLWAALSNNPIEPFSAAVGKELTTLWWVEGLFGLEVIRQIHYLISERSAGWHRLWSEGVFGGLNRFTHRINDWNRFRIGRAIKVVLLLAVLAVILAAFFHTSPFVSLFQVPAAVISALPLHPAGDVHAAHSCAAVRGAVLVPLARGRRHVLPGRREDALHRRVGAGRGARPREGEHHLPEGPRRDRVARRLRARRHPPVGTSGHGQDADRRGGRRRDAQPVRVRRPGCVHEHVHGRRHLEGEEALPQAAQARPALRRRRRVLRRGGLARQPRVPGRRSGCVRTEPDPRAGALGSVGVSRGGVHGPRDPQPGDVDELAVRPAR